MCSVKRFSICFLQSTGLKTLPACLVGNELAQGSQNLPPSGSLGNTLSIPCLLGRPSHCPAPMATATTDL